MGWGAGGRVDFPYVSVTRCFVVVVDVVVVDVLVVVVVVVPVFVVLALFFCCSCRSSTF